MNRRGLLTSRDQKSDFVKLQVHEPPRVVLCVLGEPFQQDVGDLPQPAHVDQEAILRKLGNDFKVNNILHPRHAMLMEHLRDIVDRDVPEANPCFLVNKGMIFF